MPFSRAVIDPRMLNSMRSSIEARGLDFWSILAEAGIDPELLGADQAAVPINAIGTFFDKLARTTGDDAIGLKLGMSAPIGLGGLLGQIILTSHDVRTMLENATNYIRLHVRPIDARFDTDQGIGCISWAYPASFTAPRQQYVGFSMGILVSRIRIAAGSNWTPLATTFEHRPPSDLTDYQAAFGSKLTFQAERNGISVDPTALAAKLPSQIPGIDVSLRQLGDLHLAQTPHGDNIVDEAALAVRLALASPNSYDLDAIATRLNVSPRSLQYRLQLAGRSYESVLGEVREQEAIRYLRETDLSMAEIAARLRFSEPSAFARSIRLRFDLAPTELRRQLREGAMPPPDPR